MSHHEPIYQEQVVQVFLTNFNLTYFLKQSF